MWDVACQGHPALSTQHEGRRGCEHQLITLLRSCKGNRFVKEVCKLYDNEDTVASDIKKNLLAFKYEM